MSHKTGKRVLATTATSALAFAGLIAMPMAAQAAAADVTLTDNCGYNDTISVPKDSGTYNIYTAGVLTTTLNSATGEVAPVTNRTASASFAVESGSTPATVTFNDGSAVATWTAGVGSSIEPGKLPLVQATGPAEFSTVPPVSQAYVRDTHTSATLSASAPGGSLSSKAPDAGNLGTNEKGAGAVYDISALGLRSGPTPTLLKFAKFDATTSSEKWVLTDAISSPTGALTVDVSASATGAVTAAQWTAASDGGTAANNKLAAATVPTSWSLAAGEAAGLWLNGVHYGAGSVSALDRAYSTAGATTTAPTDASGKFVFTIPSSFYNTSDAALPLKPGFAITDSAGTAVSAATIAAAGIDGLSCTVTSVPAPKYASTAAGTGKITVTKGSGVSWSLTTAEGAATTAVKVTDANGNTIPSGSSLDYLFGAATSADATIDLTLTGDGADSAKVTATPLPGNSGSTVSWTFNPDGLAVMTPVRPTSVDNDGITSDTFTVTAIDGAKWQYANVANKPVGDATGWTDVVFQSGETQTTITRPASAGTNYTLRAVPVDPAKSKWVTGTNPSYQVAFTNEYLVKSIPAPTMVDGDGAADYYVLPKIDGIKWTVTGSPNAYSGGTFLSTDTRLGTQVRVITTPGATDTYTFTASVDTSDPSKVYKIDTTAVTKTSWTGTFDNRSAIAPEGPQWVEQSGLANDAVTFPQLAPGMTYYQFAVGAKDSVPGSGGAGAYRVMDSAWYGNTVPLSEIQRVFGTANSVLLTHTQVSVKAVENSTVYTIAKDANGKTVPTEWKYAFTNDIVVAAQPPVQDDQSGTANDTLTFPVDPRVNYTVTQNGVTRAISYFDQGKPLPFTGQVTVRVTANAGYMIQPNADGTAPAPWVFTFDASSEVTPAAPQSHDRDGSDQDTYVVPNQPGVLWSVDGVDLDPSQYGKEIATGGKSQIRFVASAATGYQLADDAETEFFLDWNIPAPAGEVSVDHTIRANNYQADVEWAGPEDAVGVTYTVKFAKVTQDSDGDEVLGELHDWKTDTEETSGLFSAGYGVTYKIYVTATDEHGTEWDATEYVSFPADPLGQESRWTDINRSTVTPSGNDALGWYQAGSSLYFNDTAFVTYRDQSNVTFTVSGGQQLRIYGTEYTKGGRALIQVNGTNWAWLDAGASSEADPYKKMLRQINLPNTGTHTIKIIASLPHGKELALDAYEVVE